MSENLPRLVAELFARQQAGEELPARVQRLRGEIRRIIASEDTTFGRFRGLLESFREVIPDEKQRYAAAIKALSTTSKLSPKEIVAALSGQLDELKILEKGLTPAGDAWRGELKTIEARSKELKAEAAKLRERLAQLENEEKGIAGTIATREKEAKIVESSLRDLFAEIEAEISSAKRKIEESSAEPAAAQPLPQAEPARSAPPVEQKADDGQQLGVQTPAEPLDPKTQKKCPMCGGVMNLHEADKLWMCYSCAHEEPTEGGARYAAEETFGHVSAPEPAPATGPVFDPSRSRAARSASPSSDDDREPEEEPAQPTKTKTCPVCKKKMNFHPMERAWRCPHCNYMRRL